MHYQSSIFRLKDLFVCVLIHISLIAIFTGCATNKAYELNLMPAPDIFENGAWQPFSDTSSIKNDGTIEILYATDREPVNEKSKEKFYQNERGYLLRLGKGEVVDIEREVELSGPIHSKGVLILSGFLGARYAMERPLSLAASLVFEQSYAGVEGDNQGAGVKGQGALLAYDAATLPQLFADTLHIIPHEDGTTAIGSTSAGSVLGSPASGAENIDTAS
mgnify:CR=1 FL=1